MRPRSRADRRRPATVGQLTARRAGKWPQEKVERLVELYLSMGARSESKAVQALGYPKAEASRIASHVFKLRRVKEQLQKRQNEIALASSVTPEDLTARLKMIAFNDLAKFMVPQEDGTLIWNFKGASQTELSLINELSVESYQTGRGEVKVPVKKFRISTRDSLRAIELLGRMSGAFNDKLNLNADDALIDRLQAARTRVHSALPNDTDEAE